MSIEPETPAQRTEREARWHRDHLNDRYQDLALALLSSLEVEATQDMIDGLALALRTTSMEAAHRVLAGPASWSWECPHCPFGTGDIAAAKAHLVARPDHAFPAVLHG